jgi:hypothetical protein
MEKSLNNNEEEVNSNLDPLIYVLDIEDDNDIETDEDISMSLPSWILQLTTAA